MSQPLASLWPLRPQQQDSGASGNHHLHTAQHFSPLFLYFSRYQISSAHVTAGLAAITRCFLSMFSMKGAFCIHKKKISRLNQSWGKHFLQRGLPVSTNRLFWDTETRWPQGPTSSPPRASRSSVTLSLSAFLQICSFSASRHILARRDAKKEDKKSRPRVKK